MFYYFGDMAPLQDLRSGRGPAGPVLGTALAIAFAFIVLFRVIK